MKANKNIFQKFSDFLENIPTKLPEAAVLCLYIALIAFVSYYHEPWFDEAQSWLIARAASLKEILFIRPHYEGHPPFWWLILAPFAKAGLPYEITIKTINIAFCSLGMGIFLFKAPFKRIIKFLIPFTYFMFYQYGVISRCYCLVIVAFMLVSLTYHSRNIKPFAYIASLILLCSSSAFGIIFSGGLAVVWLLELWPFTLKDIFTKREFRALGLLLAWALVLMALLIPSADTYATNLPKPENNFIERFLFVIFVVPFNALTGAGNFSFLSETPLSYIEILYSLPCMIFLLFILKGFGKLLLFSVPFMLFALFSSAVYFSKWHCGIVFLFLLFVFWVISEEKPLFLYPKFMTERLKLLFRSLTQAGLFFILFLSLGYSYYNAQYDVKNPFSYSRKTAQLIKKYHLEDKVIFAKWISYSISDPDKKIMEEPTHVSNVDILPYFSENIINNLNFGNNDYPYDLHQTVDKESYYKEWAKGPKPDIKLGENFPLEMIWPNLPAEEEAFIMIALEPTDNPPVYMRVSLARELGLIK